MTKKTRKRIVRLLSFLPVSRRIAAERWLRGREDFRKLTAADAVVVSPGKAGRTWLLVMFSHFYQHRHHLSPDHLLEFDNFHRQNPAIPTIFFTHDDYLKDYTRTGNSKAPYYDKRVILLVRDPRDVAVSQYFQWKYRAGPTKRELKGLPAEEEGISVGTFVLQRAPRIIAFMNAWAQEIPRLNHILVVHYETIRQHPQEILKRMLAFIGTPGTDEEIAEVVAFASYDNMKKLETEGIFRSSNYRLRPRDQNNPNSYKVRRGKVGGYRDYLQDHEVAALDELVHSRLSPFYNYGTDDSTAEAVQG